MNTETQTILAVVRFSFYKLKLFVSDAAGQPLETELAIPAGAE